MAFNPEEFGLEPDPETDGESAPLTGEAAAQLIRAAQRPQPQYARRMGAIEEKFTMATYYKAVLDSDFFDNEDQFTRRVDHEIKEFVVQRIEALMNNSAQPTAAEDTFTPEETKALKLFAKRLLSPPAAKPVAPGPVAAAPRPSPEPVAAPEAPKTRRRAAVPGKPVAKAEKPVAVAPAAPAPAKGRKNRQGQFTSPGALPVPQGSAFSAASEMQARQQVADSPATQSLGEYIANRQ